MDTLGIVECKSIAHGVALSDSMLKGADVELIRSGTICPGKYMIYLAGDRASVQVAISIAKSKNIKLVGSFVISNISPQIIKAFGYKINLDEKPDKNNISALGLVESSAVAACIEAADFAIKKADVHLGKIVLGQGLAGKAYFVLVGDLESVQTAVDEAKKILDKKLIEAVVIARPKTEVIKNLMGG